MGILPVRSRTGDAPFRIFVTDYDGTLLTDDRDIRPEDLSTLHHLKMAGVTTAIATGRSLYSFNRSLAAISLSPADLCVDYLIFSTGAGILDLATGRMIRALDLGGEETRKTCAYFDAQGYDYMIHDAIPRTPHFLYKTHGGANPDFDARLSLYPDFGRPMAPELDRFPKATEVLAIVPGGQLSVSREDVQFALDRTSVIFATSPLDHRSVWIEVFHRDVSKSKAMAWLSRRLDITPGEVVAVGNDYNDVDLLRWSGLACLVENGPEEIGEGCVRVPSNNRCGVTHAARVAGLVG